MNDRAARRLWPFVAAVAGVAAYGAWLYVTPNETLRNQLRSIQFWQLEALVIALTATSVAGLRTLLRSLSLCRRDLIAPLACSLLAAVLVFGVAPRTNRIYYDEQIYQSIGQNLSDLRLAQLCNEGIVEYGVLQCSRGEYNKQPYGFPHLLSIAYRIAGTSSDVAHRVNGVSAVALAWIVYLLTVTLFDSRPAAAFASLTAALIPAHLQWSHTGASEPISAVAAAWAILALAAFLRLQSPLTLLWALVAASYAVQFRVEMLAIPPLLAAGMLMWIPLRSMVRLWWALPVTIALCAIAAAHLLAVSDESWGTTEARMSLAYLWPNLQVNARFYLWDARFPVVVTLLAAVGAWRSRSRAAVLMGLWFVAFFGTYLLFYAGSYNYGADVRYSLLTYPPLMVLAGVGAATAADWLDRRGSFTRGVPLTAAALLFQFLWYLPYVRAVGEEAWAARADVAYAQVMANALPPNAIVLTHNPGMFQVWGVNAAQLSIAATDPEYVHFMLRTRFAGGVFLHWNFWCNVSDPIQNEFCRGVENQYETEQVSEFRERDYRYALSRIVGIKLLPLPLPR